MSKKDQKTKKRSKMAKNDQKLTKNHKKKRPTNDQKPQNPSNLHSLPTTFPTLTNYSNSENFSDCLVTNGIIITPKQWMFVTLQKELDTGDRSQAWVDGPHTLFERLDNRNWRAGDSYCTNFNPEVVARLLAYTAL